MALFLKIDGVDGDSKDKDHDKWIDILNWSWGAHHPSSMQMGGGTSGGSAQVEQIRIQAKTSSATATLCKFLMEGEVKTINIHTTMKFKKEEKTWVEVELINASISSLDQSHDSDGQGGNTSMDSIVISFEECKQLIWDQKEDGTRGAEKEWSHKVGTRETS
jgi:type VI secretion system secreted protein Hcp